MIEDTLYVVCPVRVFFFFLIFKMNRSRPTIQGSNMIKFSGEVSIQLPWFFYLWKLITNLFAPWRQEKAQVSQDPTGCTPQHWRGDPSRWGKGAPVELGWFTLLGTNITCYIYHELKPNVGKYSIHGAYPIPAVTFEDDFPFPKVGYLSSRKKVSHVI